VFSYSKQNPKALSVIELENLQVRRGQELILSLPALRLEAGTQTLLTGGSGTGKSTLIHLLAGFLAADSGRYLFENRDVSKLGEREWDRLRASRIGVVFQHYPLLRGFHLLDNLLIPMGLAGQADPERAASLLERVGLSHRIHHRPSQLSAGQRQRAALVRALINRPALVLADEPTAHLDPQSGMEALALLKELVNESGSTLLLVSHDHSLRSQFADQLHLEDLNLAAPSPKASP
jgi:ABC-type lipoprotein export system ATPase subunit